MKNINSENDLELSPAELRQTFGRNLRELTKPYRSISGLCRELGINRTQFNRYLAGESFPRPEILAQICAFFEVDAQTLLGPFVRRKKAQIGREHPFLDDFVGPKPDTVSEERFPSGFYRFSRRSFLDTDLVMNGLVYVFRRDGFAFIRGYASRSIMRDLALPTNSPIREFRGVLIPQEEGVHFTISHRNNIATVFNYLSRASALQQNVWVGFSARPERDNVIKRRVTRLVYEKINGSFSDVRAVAKSTGYVPLSEIPELHQRHLRLGTPFT